MKLIGCNKNYYKLHTNESCAYMEKVKVIYKVLITLSRFLFGKYFELFVKKRKRTVSNIKIQFKILKYIQEKRNHNKKC